jgi:crotonobetainyl-CoA:carnitine CoA-transferase CaiB-like acyl-CoA transferase
MSIVDAVQWRALVEVVGDPRLDDPSLDDRVARHDRHDDVDAVLAEWAAGQDIDGAVDRLLAAGVPAAPVWNQSFIDELPQLQARGYWQHLVHPVVGKIQLPASGMWSSTIDLAFEGTAPILGEHTDAVLLAAGIDEGELASLRERGIVG